MERLDHWERALLALMVAGVGLRVWHIGGDSLAADSAWYLSMAESLTRYGEFRVPWQAGVVYTQHFPPLYPAFLALFILVLGPSYVALQTASVAAAILFVGVAFACTADLYGRRAAFAVGAIAATLPTLVWFDREGLSETFVAALFAATIWAILKSLDKPRFIVLGGLFAGMGFLAKASMGPFFLLAGAAGFLWRFAYVRWRVFRDKWYVLAALVFAACVVPWSVRNVLRHGWPNWQTQKAASVALDALWTRPDWPLIVLTAFSWALLVLLLNAMPWLLSAGRELRAWRQERTSGLLLAILTPILVAGFFIAGFSVVEGFRIVRSPHPARYAITPIVPLMWLGMRALAWAPPAPAGVPVAGRDLVRGSRALVVIGGLVVAFALAFRSPFYENADLDEVLFMMIGVLVGLAVLAVSRAFAWDPLLRARAEGPPTWRAVRRKLPRWPVLAGLGFFVAAWFLSTELVPLLLAAGAAAMVATWRQRAFVVAVVFLGWGMGGAIVTQPFDLVGADLGLRADEGDTVSARIGIEPMVWPFLPEHLEMVYWGSNATWLVQRTWDPAPPGEYEEVALYGKDSSPGPGAWLHWEIEMALRGDEHGPPAATVALYRRIEGPGPLTSP